MYIYIYIYTAADFVQAHVDGELEDQLSFARSIHKRSRVLVVIEVCSQMCIPYECCCRWCRNYCCYPVYFSSHYLRVIIRACSCIAILSVCILVLQKRLYKYQ